jgi:hypothetical protein
MRLGITMIFACSAQLARVSNLGTCIPKWRMATFEI